MKKHYAFIPLKESDIQIFRRSLIENFWFRPVFGTLVIALLCWIGFTHTAVLKENFVCLTLYLLAIIFVLYESLGEIRRLLFISRLKKSNLLSFIHAAKADAYFYNEEIPNGFIVQVEPVNFPDIVKCREELSHILEQFAESLPLYNYLNTCFNSKDASLINKAVIYTEIIKDQLASGNRAILATHDKLVNYINYDKEETS